MKSYWGLFWGSAAALAGAAPATAADLPAQPAAPIEYVRICDAYGSGSFSVPGADACLKVGGLVLSEVRAFEPSAGLGRSIAGNGAVSGLGSVILPSNPAVHLDSDSTKSGYAPTGGHFTNGRDDAGWNSLGRVELDARTGTPWGALRIFARPDADAGSALADTGSLASSGIGTFSRAARETTILNKAFIQFAGLTAGRAQPMFDFYANGSNDRRLVGSSANAQSPAYKATFDNVFDGLAATLPVEDQKPRQAFAAGAIASTNDAPAAASPAPIAVGSPGIAGASFQGAPAGGAWPDIIGNVRVDQPWDSAQLSAAGHEARASLMASTALLSTGPATSYAFPAATTDAYGWAAQGGVQLNADYLSPGDRLWLQAAYEKGAVSSIWGDNLSFSYGSPGGDRSYGAGSPATGSAAGWNSNIMDCIFTFSGICEQQSAWAVTAANKHYWLPTLASANYGSYAEINYSNNALAGFGGGVGVMNLKNARGGANLVWPPIRGFDVGAEFMYSKVAQTRPSGLAPGVVLNSVGLPSFEGTANPYEGRVRVQRAF